MRFSARKTLACSVWAAVIWLAALSILTALLPRLGLHDGRVLPALSLVAFAGAVVASIRHIRSTMARQAEAGEPHSPGILPRGTTNAVVIAVAVGLPALLGTIDIARQLGSYAGMPPWFMRNDMVMNTLHTADIHLDGGVGAEGRRSNPAFLTHAITSLFYGFSDSMPSLRTMITGNVISVMAMCLMASLLGAIYIVVKMRHAPTWARVVAALAFGWLPYCGVLLGSVIMFGHVNMILTYLVLLLALVVDASGLFETRDVIFLETWLALVALATWAPTAIVPMSLAGLSLLRIMCARGSTLKRAISWRYLALPAVLLGMFIVTVTLPALAQDGDQLAAGGSTLGDAFTILSACICVLLAMVLLHAVMMNSVNAGVRHTVWRHVALTAAALIGVAYLATTGRDVATWSYYPAKFCLIMTLLLGVSVASEALACWPETQAIRASSRRRRLTRLGWPLVLVLVATLSAAGVAALPLPPTWGHRAVVAPLHSSVLDPAVERDEYVSAWNRAVAAFDANPGSATVFLRESTPQLDADRNRFFIQFSAPTDDEVRYFAYYAEISQDEYPSLLCPLLAAWHKEATIVTSDENRDQVENEARECHMPDPVRITSSVSKTRP